MQAAVPRMRASIRRCRLWKKRLNLENPIVSSAGMGHLCSAGGMAQ